MKLFTMIAFFRMMGTALAVLTMGWAQGQTCYNATFYLSSAEGGPTSAGLSILNAEGYEVVPAFNASLAEDWQETFCLYPGCYTLAVQAGLPWEAVSVDWEAFGAEQEFEEVLVGDATMWYTFCVNPEVMPDCPDAIDYLAVDGCLGTFEIGSFVEGEVVEWNFLDGTEPVTGGHFIQHEYAANGTYDVIAQYASAVCPEGVQLVGTVEVTGCSNDCPLAIEGASFDGMMWLFTATGPPPGTALDWFIDGEYILTNESGLFEAGFDFNPFWEVCVGYASGPCEGNVEACFSNMGGSGCPDGPLLVDQLEGCTFQITAGTGNPNAGTTWSVDGVYQTEEGPVLLVDFPEGGVHEVSAYYWSTTCPGETYTTVVDATGCGESDCNMEAHAEAMACDSFAVWATGVPPGVAVAWTLDGEPMPGLGALEFAYAVPDMECHVFAFTAQSGACEGQGDEVQICPTACTDCAASLDVVALADGVYQFTALTATGAVYEGPTTWWFGEGAALEGNPVAYTWYTDTPAQVEVCAAFAAWDGCPEAGELCIPMQPVAPPCEEVTIALDASAIGAAELQMLWLLAGEIAGLELGGLDLEGAWNWVNEAAFEVTFCLPTACYDLELAWDGWPVAGELFSVAIEGAAEVDPAAVLGAAAGSLVLEFGWASDCLALLQPEMTGGALRLFPNPATGTVQWSSLGSQAASVRVLDRSGRVVWTGLAPHFDTSDWAPGVYFVEAETRTGERLVERLVVVH